MSLFHMLNQFHAFLPWKTRRSLSMPSENIRKPEDMVSADHTRHAPINIFLR